MSLGGSSTDITCDSDPRKALVDLLLTVQTATVIAAGNSFFINAVAFPGCISTAVTVSASSKRKAGKPERTSIYSNISTVTDVLAPGGDVGYPFKSKKDRIRSSYGGGYSNLAGTSMAAPHVAGAIAAIRSRPACSSKTIAQIVNALKSSGKAIKDWRKVPGFPRITKPRINVLAAMKAMGCA
jgi:subtilisin family serine protease